MQYKLMGSLGKNRGNGVKIQVLTKILLSTPVQGEHLVKRL